MKAVALQLFVIISTSGWDLTNYGINYNYYASSIGIYRSRAFLALPRSVCHNNISSPTVVEVAWTGDHIYPVTTIKSPRNKLLEHQEWGKCEDLQDAISLDVEPRKPKIWILDKGNEHCPPKVVSYSLFYNYMFDSCELEDIPRDNLNIFVIDPEHGRFGYRAYIGNAGDDTLLIFFLEKLKYRKLKLIHLTLPYTPVKSLFISLSKTEPILYTTDMTSTELYSINLKNIRDHELGSDFTEDTGLEENVTFIGNKLGISSGLETDYKEGLSYFMIKDYVIVRWLIGSPVEAEYHNVLAQSYEKFPFVSQLFTGPQNGLWALVNSLPPYKCIGTDDITSENEDISIPESRVVKILKYNKFVMF